MDSDTVSIIIKLVVLLFLLIFSAFFSSAETALTCVSNIKLKTMADDGDKKAKRVLEVIEDPNRMLSAILIGNNVVNLSASSLATVVMVELFGSVGAGIATFILTFLILIFGEITPKTLAQKNSLRISLRYAPVIYGMMMALTPIIAAVNILSGLFIKMLGKEGDADADVITEEEIRTIVDVSHENGSIEQDEREMIHKVFDFSDATAKEVMIPRIDMALCDVNWNYQQLVDEYRENMYTRLPVFEDDSDKIIGMVNMKDLIFVNPGDDFSIRNYIREVYFTYEHKNISDLFDEMRAQSFSLAIVLDEYGSLAGMITLEDLLEELVGEIRDEYDGDEEDPIVEINAREYKVLGSVNLEDLCQKLPLDFESEDYDTIGGYLTGIFDHFPSAGETYVTEDGTILRIDEMEDKRVTRVHIKFPKAINIPEQDQ